MMVVASSEMGYRGTAVGIGYVPEISSVGTMLMGTAVGRVSGSGVGVLVGVGVSVGVDVGVGVGVGVAVAVGVGVDVGVAVGVSVGMVGIGVGEITLMSGVLPLPVVVSARAVSKILASSTTTTAARMTHRMESAMLLAVVFWDLGDISAVWDLLHSIHFKRLSYIVQQLLSLTQD
jgi:hypothetical protein